MSHILYIIVKIQKPKTKDFGIRDFFLKNNLYIFFINFDNLKYIIKNIMYYAVKKTKIFDVHLCILKTNYFLYLNYFLSSNKYMCFNPTFIIITRICFNGNINASYY